ncbi:hypothetical protein KAJ87_00440 [Candidatus Pacearchaeota archaeon]|nr:hypothetical protein [Candidatus Pacearchaeota archaeon]
MVQTKKMNEVFFAEILKDFNVRGELIRARQDEKQGLLDEFSAESKRFFFGKISERTLASSVKKTNNELARLDKEIRENITKARSASERAAKLSAMQAPINYKATISGITGGVKKKKPVAKKKVVKRKPVKKITVKRKVVKKKVVIKRKPVTKRKSSSKKKK